MNMAPLLICLDLQQSFINEAALGAPNGPRALLESARLLAFARARRWSIAHCYLRRSAEPLRICARAALPIAGFEPRASEPVIERATLSAYGHEAFADLVEAAPHRCALIIGLSASLTFMATAFDAFERGHRFVVAIDALAAQSGEEADASSHEKVTRDVVAYLGFSAASRMSAAGYGTSMFSLEGKAHEVIAKT